jgi:hypothetical protein
MLEMCIVFTNSTYMRAGNIVKIRIAEICVLLLVRIYPHKRLTKLESNTVNNTLLMSGITTQCCVSSCSVTDTLLF